ncbi:hypothetical protein, partial [Pseudomonas syringae]|uniref:hypothetical protein n=1 Tax=Pseudomonas syringae TaxID=317 RepID=UPI001E5D399F
RWFESNRAYQTKSALLGGKKRVSREVDPFLFLLCAHGAKISRIQRVTAKKNLTGIRISVECRPTAGT